MRRPGLWVTNGNLGDPTQMLSWNPAALTSFFDYLIPNGVFGYKAAFPQTPIIIRFQHPLNWHENPSYSAQQLGQMVASKWNEISVLDPYVYFANEINLHYENGDENPDNQPSKSRFDRFPWSTNLGRRSGGSDGAASPGSQVVADCTPASSSQGRNSVRNSPLG